MGAVPKIRMHHYLMRTLLSFPTAELRYRYLTEAHITYELSYWPLRGAMARADRDSLMIRLTKGERRHELGEK
eukprot:7835534-Pyramimonas_sp.AAC.1